MSLARPCLVAFLLVSSVAHASEWTRFRGPNGTGVNEAADIPVEWKEENILFRTKLSEEMFKGLAPWLQWLPGRLMHVNIVGCGIFATMSGSSAATCATIGKIALPELEKRGYDKNMSLGSLGRAAGFWLD